MDGNQNYPRRSPVDAEYEEVVKALRSRKCEHGVFAPTCQACLEKRNREALAEQTSRTGWCVHGRYVTEACPYCEGTAKMETRGPITMTVGEFCAAVAIGFLIGMTVAFMIGGLVPQARADQVINRPLTFNDVMSGTAGGGAISTTAQVDYAKRLIDDRDQKTKTQEKLRALHADQVDVSLNDTGVFASASTCYVYVSGSTQVCGPISVPIERQMLIDALQRAYCSGVVGSGLVRNPAVDKGERMGQQISLEQIIPGGIRTTDHWHRRVNDGTCSRCRKPMPEGDVPLMLWGHGGHDLLIYCETCLGVEKAPAEDAAQ